VPITIKDSLDTEGIVSTGGTPGRRQFVPDQDAPVVARLRAAGAVLLGKTNTPELTFSGETCNLIYGRTSNPFDLERSPGGSSGGSAAIIACGGSALEIGSDTGGSIREPAHLCGIAGIKPTSGRTPRSGHIVPHGGGVFDSLTQLGPMARYVEDLALAVIHKVVDQNPAAGQAADLVKHVTFVIDVPASFERSLPGPVAIHDGKLAVPQWLAKPRVTCQAGQTADRKYRRRTQASPRVVGRSRLDSVWLTSLFNPYRGALHRSAKLAPIPHAVANTPR